MTISFHSTYRVIALLSLTTLGMGLLASHTILAQNGKPHSNEIAKLSQTAREILKQNCFSCHSGEKPMGGLRLTSREDMIKGGASGSALSLQKPEESLLLKAVRFQGRQMPPSGKLSFQQIEALSRWVRLGAPMTASKASDTPPSGPPPVNAETKRFWSFQRVKVPTVPLVKNRSWVRSPIDAFILNGLENSGLTPNAPASRATLIRRAYYDLTGLPPSPEAVRAFLADTSPKAWEKVIDRLLGSPQYGEKWGRHWLDLVHFAETNSYERDGPKANAWRYRDYVIQSFNADKPYNQFVLEQLAGDEMPNRTHEQLIATGYYRLGIWDDEPVDRLQALYDDMDDVLSTTAQVYLGLTVNCARCHDHKIDPIPQKDYYRMLSFFAGVNRFGDHVQRPLSPEPLVRQHKAEVEAHEARVKQNQMGLAEIEKKVIPDFSPVEKEEFQNDNTRPGIVQKRIGKQITQAEYDRYVALRKEREEIGKFQPTVLDMAMTVTEDPNPRVTHVLMRGNAHAEGDLVEPAFPSVLSPPAPLLASNPNGDSCGRRTAFAKWLVNPENPLTARVIVNRIWQYHFGRGIVRTPSNFGFQGAKPTHPELLDWLASTFVQSGWRLKPFHKRIMMSSTYQMSTQSNPKAYAKDPENDLFWRFDMRRLQAEEIRDSILVANGSLNRQMGGRSIYVTIPDAVLAGQSVPGSGWGNSPPDQQCRRSIYIFVKRSLITPIIASFDGPETDLSCPLRFATTQPTQALGMINSAFIHHEAEVFAKNVIAKVGTYPDRQVRFALWQVLQREPTAKEIQRGLHLIGRMQSQHQRSPEEALKYFCVVALNLNEFIYLE